MKTYSEFLFENRNDQKEQKFIQFCKDFLGIKNVPKIEKMGREWSVMNGSFGGWHPELGIAIVCDGRHPMDWMRSLAHELVHQSQFEKGINLDGSTGSDCENEANALAGTIMRMWKDEANNPF